MCPQLVPFKAILCYKSSEFALPSLYFTRIGSILNINSATLWQVCQYTYKQCYLIVPCRTVKSQVFTLLTNLLNNNQNFNCLPFKYCILGLNIEMVVQDGYEKYGVVLFDGESLPHFCTIQTTVNNLCMPITIIMNHKGVGMAYEPKNSLNSPRHTSLFTFFANTVRL